MTETVASLTARILPSKFSKSPLMTQTRSPILNFLCFILSKIFEFNESSFSNRLSSASDGSTPEVIIACIGNVLMRKPSFVYCCPWYIKKPSSSSYSSFGLLRIEKLKLRHFTSGRVIYLKHILS